jgi:autotransporter-associated beta strand protein
VSHIGSTQQYQGFGIFEKTGDSTWILIGSGAQNWNISQGTLVGDTNSLQGNAIANNAALIFSQGFDGSYSGTISGTGTLTKAGSGMLTLLGNHTYTGATIVNGGTLEVDGSIASSSGLTVNSGGTLSGVGTLPMTTINGGTLAPGNSTGTLNVGGNLVFTSAATYLIQISSTSASKTVVTIAAAASAPQCPSRPSRMRCRPSSPWPTRRLSRRPRCRGSGPGSWPTRRRSTYGAQRSVEPAA